MNSRMRRIHRGFTLVEMMVAVAVLAVIVLLAAPSFRALLEAQRMRSAAFDLMADLTLARSEALKRGQIATPVTLAPATDGWASGWTLSVGTEVLSKRNTVGAGVSISGPTSVTYDLNGRPSNISDVVKFGLTDSSETRHRCISLDPSGHPKSLSKECAE